jgi:hypothetical protein
VTLVRDGSGAVGGAEGAGAWTEGDDSGRAGGRDEAGRGAEAGGDDWGAGENSDSSRPTPPESSGVPGFSGALITSGGTGGQADWLPGAVDGRGGPAGEGSGSGLPQAEKGGSGLETGGNSDSGGPDDTRPDGDVCRGSAEPAGTGEEDPAGWPRGVTGRRAETRKPHASQN